MVVSAPPGGTIPKYWPSARHFTEAIQCPSVCFAHPLLRNTLPALDRLGMPLVTSGQFAYVYKLKSMNGNGDFAVRCFRGYLGDRDQRYRAIQEHVFASPAGCLSEFNYSAEGILVGGNRYPVLFMNWIEGPTLDLYIGEMLHRRDVLHHLAGQWLRLVHSLRAAEIAHGDLQHGNIIVEHGQLRLVDHDGIFVPGMKGWSASEVGHQHYQHPRREPHHFNAELDSFSALVIYLSLLALAERPELWREHHDENLLFTRNDFVDPDASSLFRKIREIGPEPARLADVLAESAAGEPQKVPRLLDLVKTKSGLPPWMTAPADLEAKTTTREIVRDVLTVPQARWGNRKKGRDSTVPHAPITTTFTTLFSAAPVSVRDPSDIAGNTIFYAKEAAPYFLALFWLTYLVLSFLGFDFLIAVFTAILCVSVGCLTFGMLRSLDEGAKARRANLTAKPKPALAGPKAPQSLPITWKPDGNAPPTVLTMAPTDPFIGNLMLGIFHLGTCDWVNRISIRNRVGFPTAAEAVSRGFKPCRICSPA